MTIGFSYVYMYAGQNLLTIWIRHTCQMCSQGEFIGALSYTGHVPGFDYKAGPRGMGYYRNGSVQAPVNGRAVRLMHTLILSGRLP